MNNIEFTLGKNVNLLQLKSNPHVIWNNEYWNNRADP